MQHPAQCEREITAVAGGEVESGKRGKVSSQVSTRSLLPPRQPTSTSIQLITLMAGCSAAPARPGRWLRRAARRSGCWCRAAASGRAPLLPQRLTNHASRSPGLRPVIGLVIRGIWSWRSGPCSTPRRASVSCSMPASERGRRWCLVVASKRNKASAIEAWLDQLIECSTILPKSALIWAKTAAGRDVQAGQWS